MVVTLSIVKPAALGPGARLAVIAPASSAKPERIDKGVAALRALGYEVVEGTHLRGRCPPYFSGTIEERLEDLHWAFSDPTIAGILCSRGGYGSNYLLEQLSLDLVRRNPKPLFAYSDMTVLQNWLLDRTGLVSFHGPMAAADFFRDGGVDHRSLEAAINGGTAKLGNEQGLRGLRDGDISGTLYGGCLSMMVSVLGSRFEGETEGKLLFLEDVHAKPYQVDRMLRQLILAGKLDGVKGVVFGEMLDCMPSGADSEMMESMILRVLDWLEGPIAIGLRSGHVSRENVTLPLGIEARLQVTSESATLDFLEPAVAV